MNKSTTNEEVKEETQEQSKTEVSDKEKKNNTTNKILFGVCLLLLAGATAYAITPFLLPYFSETTLFNPEEPSSQEVSLDDSATSTQSENTPVNTFFVEGDYSPDEDFSMLKTKGETLETSVAVTKQPMASIPSNIEAMNTPFGEEAASVSEQTNSVLEQPQITATFVQTTPILNTVPAQNTSLQQNNQLDKDLFLKLVQLDEAIKKGIPCRSLTNEVMVLNTDANLDKKLIEIMHICLEDPFSKQMEQIFQRSKKRAIFRILKNENSPTMAYLKMIPYTLVAIQKKTVDSDLPMDTLYQLQNAVQNNQFTQVLDLIDKLPENVQRVFYDLKQCAFRENQASELLQDLIQNSAIMGGNHE